MNKSFFNGEDGFVDFAQLPHEKRKKILNGEPIDTAEVDSILEEVKKKATANKKKKEKDACKEKKNSQAKL